MLVNSGEKEAESERDREEAQGERYIEILHQTHLSLSLSLSVFGLFLFLEIVAKLIQRKTRANRPQERKREEKKGKLICSKILDRKRPRARDR